MKKQSKSGASAPIVTNDELSKLVKIILIIVVIVVAFYALTVLITKFSKSKYDYNSSNPAVLQYDEIILGSLLTAPRSEYYVLVLKEKDFYESLYTTYQQLYSGKDSALKIYTSNLDSVFNARYLGTESNLLVENVADLKLKDATLFYVKDHKILEAYEGREQIVEKFSAMIK